MRARREASTPPAIPGFEYVRLLGLGGFADVFEYRQDLPQRSVAVKVLLASSIDEATRERFFVEANLMAQLSHHPSIVTIHHADIAADGPPFSVAGAQPATRNTVRIAPAGLSMSSVVR